MSAPVKVTNLYGRKAAAGHGYNWITIIAMTAFHIGALAAFFYIDFGAILTMFVMWFVAGSLGIGMAYHRLLTHRGYKTYKWVEYFLTFCGTPPFVPVRRGFRAVRWYGARQFRQIA